MISIIAPSPDRFDRCEAGQVIEEGIAGLIEDNFVARIAEQPEQEAVGLAGAGCQHNLLGLERDTVLRVVGADGLARWLQAAWLRARIRDCLWRRAMVKGTMYLTG